MDPLFVLFSLVLLALLVLEWRRRSLAIRVLAILMALVQLWMAQPVPRRVARNVIGLPHDQRVTTLGQGSSELDGYQSGVATLEREMQRDIDSWRPDRLVAVSALVWLAISPSIQRRRSQPPATGEAAHGEPAA